MNKLIIIAMIGFGSMLIGCSRNTYEDASDKHSAWTSHGRYVMTKIVEIEGHKYIIMDNIECGNMIHAESCKCKMKGIQNEN